MLLGELHHCARRRDLLPSLCSNFWHFVLTVQVACRRGNRLVSSLQQYRYASIKVAPILSSFSGEGGRKCEAVVGRKVSAPFCRTCNRAFATRGSLNRHMEMHRPLRVKHPCHLCIKEFAWPSDLTTHLRISHGSPQSRLGHRAPRLRMPPSAET